MLRFRKSNAKYINGRVSFVSRRKSGLTLYFSIEEMAIDACDGKFVLPAREDNDVFAQELMNCAGYFFEM